MALENKDGLLEESVSGQVSLDPAPLRLSPVELRNRELINDPALEGYDVSGRSPAGQEGKRLAKMDDAEPFGDFWYVPDREGRGIELLGYDGASSKVEIPSEIEGRPVTSLASGLFEGHDEICDVLIPDSVENLGNHVFGGCDGITIIRLPEAVGRIPASSFADCSSLETIEIEAPSVRIDRGAFMHTPLRRIVLGKKVVEIDHAPADFPCLENVFVDGENPVLASDGEALMSKDGRTLVRLAVTKRSYVVPEGCEEIGERAFDSIEKLGDVTFPETLVSIGRLAFAKTGLRVVNLPPSLLSLAEKAFYHCSDLATCTLPEGLRSIGQEAFANTALKCAALPASLEDLGQGAFAGTPAQMAISEGAISISKDNPYLRLDAQGGLYRGGAEVCDELAEIIGLVTGYQVQYGTLRIARGACRRHTTLQGIELPETLEEIAAEAFRGCRKLEWVSLPESLESIGAYAFAETKVHSLRISKNVHYLGESALLVRGEGLAKSGQPLQALDLDPENPVFYLESGLLCERGAGHAGGDICLLYVGPDNIVYVPNAVNRIAPSAFGGARGIDELYVHAHLHSVCHEGFSTARPIPVVHVAFPVSIEGVTGASFVVPSFTPQFRSLSNLFTTNEYGTVFNFAYYDAWVSHAKRIEEFAPAALARLTRPLRLSERAREVYLGIFARKKAQVCQLFAKRGDFAALDALCNLGILGQEDVTSELELATSAGQAQATACLLELRRRRGWHVGIDFGL